MQVMSAGRRMRVAEVSCYPLGSTLEGDARARDDAELAEATKDGEEKLRAPGG